MDMSGEVRIAAPREAVWRALNDPEILRQCIPGCEEIVKLSDTEMTAKVTAKVGPVKAKFGGKVTLSDLDPPNGYKISGEGQGGAAGFAKGGAVVRLTTDETGGTMLHYEVSAAVGGKLAQIGSRLIDGTARKMADDFFATFAALVTAAAAPAVEAAAASPGPSGGPSGGPSPGPPPRPPAPPSPPARVGLPPWVWVGGLIVVIAILLAIFGRG